MKLKISLARHNGRSALARVENDDELDIDIADCSTPRAACLKAAKALREAADRFDLLAQEPEPYHGKTHDRINRAKLTPNDEAHRKDAAGGLSGGADCSAAGEE